MKPGKAGAMPAISTTTDRNNVLRKFDLVLSAAVGCAILTSCGGSPTPSPSPTPTPSGSGTPTPTPSATPAAFTFATDFTLGSASLYIYANFTPTGGAAVFSDASRVSGLGGLQFIASPEKASFGFPDLTSTVDYLGSERTTTTATLRAYTRSTTSLTLEKPFTNTLRATYLRTDPFTRSSVVGTLEGYRVALFVLPVTTTTAIGSSLTFAGSPRVVGGTPGTTRPGAVTAAPVTFTVVPAASATALPTITGTVRVSETASGTTTERAVLAFSGTLDANGAFNGTIADTANAFTGAFSGTLAGPNREEVALVFAASHADGRKYVGDVLAD
jgi:hypothetical protein